jgi:hypothetical protein
MGGVCVKDLVQGAEAPYYKRVEGL